MQIFDLRSHFFEQPLGGGSSSAHPYVIFRTEPYGIQSGSIHDAVCAGILASAELRQHLSVGTLAPGNENHDVVAAGEFGQFPVTGRHLPADGIVHGKKIRRRHLPCKRIAYLLVLHRAFCSLGEDIDVSGRVDPAVGESLLFGPEEPVTRGEFIAMCAELLGQDPEAEPLESGFADEIPAWLRPYVSTALQCGFLQGVPGQDGLLLEAGKPVTHAQAAAMLGSMLGLSPEASPVMGDLTAASSEVLPLSRRDAAQLLYGAAQYSAAHSEAPGLLAWAAR